MTFRFRGKYIINAELHCLTGLRIGGMAEEFEIGGLDNPVIKNPLDGKPYIPGSSLKGKMRSLMEWALGKVDVKPGRSGSLQAEPHSCKDPACDICAVFGTSAAEEAQAGPTRLTVFDAMPAAGTVLQWEEVLGENVYTEIKTENRLDRLTSAADPRSMERVPQGSAFEVVMAFDLYQEEDEPRLKRIFEAMALLEDSALGGSTSRGSGRVAFEKISVEKRTPAYYLENAAPLEYDLSEKTPLEIGRDFAAIFEPGR